MRVTPPPFWTPVHHCQLREFQLLNNGHPTAFLLAAFLCVYCRETKKTRFPKRALPQIGTGLRRSQLRSALKSLMDQGLVSEDGDDLVVQPMAVFGDRPPVDETDDDQVGVGAEPAADTTRPERDQVRTTSEPTRATSAPQPDTALSKDEPVRAKPEPVADTQPPRRPNDSEHLAAPYNRREDSKNREEERITEERQATPAPLSASPVFVKLAPGAQEPGARATFPPGWRPSKAHLDYAVESFGMTAPEVIECHREYTKKTYSATQFTDPHAYFYRCIDFWAEEHNKRPALLPPGRRLHNKLTGAAESRPEDAR